MRENTGGSGVHVGYIPACGNSAYIWNTTKWKAHWRRYKEDKEGVSAAWYIALILRNYARGNNMPDRRALESNLESFFDKKLITDVLSIVKSGKEATVYKCKAHTSTGERFLVGKVYRSLKNRSFRNDSIYQQGRLVWDGGNSRALKKKSKWGRDLQFDSWISNEFDTLNALHEAGADVPRPFAHTRNAILMEYIGDSQEAAPTLNNVSLQSGGAEAIFIFYQLMSNIELMLNANRIHADLSAFNVLYWQGSIKIIDFPQSVHPRRNPLAFDLLLRDIENIYAYFSRYGVQLDPFQRAEELWMEFLGQKTEGSRLL